MRPMLQTGLAVPSFSPLFPLPVSRPDDYGVSTIFKASAGFPHSSAPFPWVALCASAPFLIHLQNDPTPSSASLARQASSPGIFFFFLIYFFIYLTALCLSCYIWDLVP